MPKMIFVNLPVADLPRSIAFYEAIGTVNNPQFTDDTAACMVLSETIYVMLLTHPKFAQFTPKPIADAHAGSQVLLALSQESRDAVDEMMAKAGEAGGTVDIAPVQEHGFMYGRSFGDLDGHIWEIFWMDPAAAGGEPPGS
ncbi:lactoylglutathione lyase [Ancylobacter sp. A5.8]|uniref:VOC family protein n=1 Tax=Ancylobacter gelatini TaxID=2919920 RepID=UPI001F4D613F|nr:lactoylglutathione lyase [Ancylobacter gelatini]MCJ8143972.1 lactoylglutathione lyase [Ancylobacter gelatini]